MVEGSQGPREQAFIVFIKRLQFNIHLAVEQ